MKRIVSLVCVLCLTGCMAGGVGFTHRPPDEVPPDGNVMLELMEAGMPFDEALKVARDRDLTEPDPELDTSGWDTSQKIKLLLTRATGRRYVGHDLFTLGLESIDPELPRKARELDLRIKLVALAKLSGNTLTATVRPMAVRSESHMGLVRGVNNAV